jgi:hypothetical protein
MVLVKASVFPSSPILVTLMKNALSSSETSVLTRATRRNITEYTILHSHSRENLKSYSLTMFPPRLDAETPRPASPSGQRGHADSSAPPYCLLLALSPFVLSVSFPSIC